MIFGLIIGRDAYNRFEDRKQLGVTVINKSTRLRRIWVRQFYIRSGKAHPPAHIEICVGGCNAVDGHKDKQDVELFFSGALSNHVLTNRGHPVYGEAIFDGFVKSPIRLRRINICVTLLPSSLRSTISTPHSSGFASLDLELFTKPSGVRLFTSSSYLTHKKRTAECPISNHECLRKVSLRDGDDLKKTNAFLRHWISVC